MSTDRKSKRNLDRRRFLEFMGANAVLGSVVLGGSALMGSCASRELSKAPVDGQIPVLPYSDKDDLLVAEGIKYSILASWGDVIKSDGTSLGFNNDFLAFFPIDNSTSEGVLCINHESPHSGFVANYWSDDYSNKSKMQVDLERKAVGVSTLHIRQENGKWQFVKNSQFNRRIDGTTEMPLVSDREIVGSRKAIGTLGNCAGGVTPWGTYLTCEENYDMYYGEAFVKAGKRQIGMGPSNYQLMWQKFYPLPPEHYGWVVEIHPMTGVSKKLTALGRFAHECATVRPSKNDLCVVYMGDDANNECIYKFISSQPESLEKGTLYVANIDKGQWLPLDLDANPALKGQFKNQTDLLIRTREAAKIVGGTPMDRPEDIEICPRTGAIIVTLTNNSEKGNLFGSLLRIEETGNDPFAMTFKSSTFLAGGEATGFACPDNLAFDRKGNLWMTTDMSGSKMNKGPYAPFKNNGLFYIPMQGPQAGKAHLVATAPRDAEFTGPTFSPDGKTLFLCVQHPGELSKGPGQYTSHWPTGQIPKPSVVCLSGGIIS